MRRRGNQYPVGKGATVYCTSIPFFYLLPCSLLPLEEGYPAATPQACWITINQLHQKYKPSFNKSIRFGGFGGNLGEEWILFKKSSTKQYILIRNEQSHDLFVRSKGFSPSFKLRREPLNERSTITHPYSSGEGIKIDRTIE